MLIKPILDLILVNIDAGGGCEEPPVRTRHGQMSIHTQAGGTPLLDRAQCAQRRESEIFVT